MVKNDSIALKQNTDFLKGNLGKAVPSSMLTILSANINVFVDGILVGHKIGTNALAAINLSLPVQLFLYVVGSFIGSGTAINAAKAVGRGNIKNSMEFYCTAVKGSFLISIILTVIGLFFRTPLVALLCPDRALQEMVMEYTVISLVGALSRIMIYVPLWYLRLDGRNLNVLVMMGILSIGNIILDILFVYQMDLGIFGAGLASVVSTTIAFVLGMVWLTGRKSNFHFTKIKHKKHTESEAGSTVKTDKIGIINSKEELWEIVRAGVPSALNNLLATIRILIINYVFINFGGSALVAEFSAVNGIAGFGECILLGIPQAGSAMLGVYSGEKDNGSMSILVSLEWKIGIIYSIIYIGIVMACSDFIRAIYGLPMSLYIPLLCMSLSVLPGLWCNILLTFYNMTDRSLSADALIISRFFVMTALGLLIAVLANISLFSFFIFSEVGTIAVWFIISYIYTRRHNIN